MPSKPRDPNKPIAPSSHGGKSSQFATLSTSSRKKFDALIAREGLVRSVLLRSWVDLFVAGSDAMLPTQAYGTRGDGPRESPSEKIIFDLAPARKMAFRQRAREMGASQTALLRAWIEPWCARAEQLDPPAKNAAETRNARAIPAEQAAFRMRAPAALKNDFANLCGSQGFNPRHALSRWAAGLAAGLDRDPPPTACGTAHGDAPRAANDAGMSILMPKDVLRDAKRASRAHGRNLGESMRLWMAASVRLGACSGFGGEAPPTLGMGNSQSGAALRVGRLDGQFVMLLNSSSRAAVIAKCAR